MRLTPSDIVTFYVPKPCAGRVYLRAKGEPEAERSPYQKVLETLGIRHEKGHLATLGTYEDLSAISADDAVERTKAAIAEHVAVIYQAAFEAAASIDHVDVQIYGRPDFLLLDGADYIIRDSKMSRRITEKDHIEIILQLQLYGWLFEKTVGHPARRLEVHSGIGDIVEVPYDRGAAALNRLAEIVKLKSAAIEAYEPVGWSKCTGCGFDERCWKIAEESKDVAIVSGVEQSMARALHGEGACTYPELLTRFTVDTLSELKHAHGNRMQRIGKAAQKILVNADVLSTGNEKIIADPEIPSHGNYVMFDLEGMPPHLDELEKIYLWGVQVFGEQPSEYLAATSGFGSDGDKQGWLDFLARAKEVFSKYGDIPFVHWAPYERTHVKQYIERYGDPEGVAARVLGNLLDLHPITVAAVALPLPSYSLKVVEEYVGFKRTQDEYGGDWAMAMFIEATETEDEAKRKEVMDAILKYNEEDLAATWAVFEWLRNKH